MHVMTDISFSFHFNPCKFGQSNPGGAQTLYHPQVRILSRNNNNVWKEYSHVLRPLMRSSYQNGECIREQIRDTYEPISFYTSSESSSEIRCCNHEGKYFHQKFGFVSSPSDDQCNQERIMLWVSVMMTRIIEITENKIQFREVDQK